MKILSFQSSVAPHVQQSARALFEAGWLQQFVTTFRHRPNSVLQKSLSSLAHIFGADLERQLRRRFVTELPAEIVKSFPSTEVIRLIVDRLDRSGRLSDLVWQWAEPAFDRKVAALLDRGELDAVYGFEYGSLATFTKARELGLHVIYEVPAPEPRFVQSILDQEAERFPVLKTPYYHHTARREEKRIARRRSEWNLADHIICNSTFTKNSYEAAGLDVSKVKVVPLGAPVLIGEIAARSKPRGSFQEPLKLLWAGNFKALKGAHYLLQAWRNHNLGRHARLKVFGAVGLPDELLKPIPEGIEFGGSIPRAELDEHYCSADALVFPTLCDGFGMVATEAWSRGLPVITTDRAGAADLLKPGVNGLLHQAGSADALAEAVVWCLDHRGQLWDMREEALKTATNWQWADYRAGLRAVLETLAEGEGKRPGE